MENLVAFDTGTCRKSPGAPRCPTKRCWTTPTADLEKFILKGEAAVKPEHAPQPASEPAAKRSRTRGESCKASASPSSLTSEPQVAGPNKNPARPVQPRRETMTGWTPSLSDPLNQKMYFPMSQAGRSSLALSFRL